MTQFESLTAHRAVSSEGLAAGARRAVDSVLGKGAVDYSTADGDSLDLLDGEELAVMHRITGALGELSVTDLMLKATTLLPESFKRESSHELYVPQTRTTESLTGPRRDLVLVLSSIKRQRKERKAFTDAYDMLAGVKIPWQNFAPGIKLGTVANGAKIERSELREIRRRMPIKRTKLERGQGRKVNIKAV